MQHSSSNRLPISTFVQGKLFQQTFHSRSARCEENLQQADKEVPAVRTPSLANSLLRH